MNEKAIKQYNESNKDKDQPFVSCNSYLDKSNEQKKKIEEKILELENTMETNHIKRIFFLFLTKGIC